MNDPIRRLAYGILTIFAVLAVVATYTQAVAGPEYRDDPRNVRLAAFRTGRERGAIVTADGTVVAVSQPDPDDPRSFRRSYPHRDLYGHVVGYTSVLFSSTGLEKERARDLVSNRGSTISGVLDVVFGRDIGPRGLRLTIEHELQAAAAEALGDQRGAIVALDPATGAVLAMVSSPGFDPNTVIGRGAGSAGVALEQDPDRPLVDRAIEEVYPPGSTFKVITTAAALESGVAGPSASFPDRLEQTLPGSTATIRNFDRGRCGEGTEVTLADAFVRSCNTVFAALGMQVGAERLVTTAEAFGFNEEIPFDLPVVAARIPEAASFSDDPAATAQNAIGQRDVVATPMQMALVAAAVANDGTAMVPYVVDTVFTSDGRVEERTEPVPWRRAVSPATAAVLAELMERTVISGTARRAAVPGVRIAGKTGTAEVTGGAPHAWFIGFAPLDPEPGRRQIAVAVVVESGGVAGESASGGSVAAPIAADLFREFLGLPG